MDYSWNSSSPPPPELASFREKAFSGEDFCRILLGFATTSSSSLDFLFVVVRVKGFIFYVLARVFIFLGCHFICTPCVSQHGFSKSRKNFQFSSVKPNVEVAKWALKRKRRL